MITVERLAQEVGDTDAEQTEALQSILDTAEALVSNWVGTTVVPEAILDLAILRVAVFMTTQSSVATVVDPTYYETDQSPAPVSRDPLAPAYPLLNKWVLPW